MYVWNMLIAVCDRCKPSASTCLLFGVAMPVVRDTRHRRTQQKVYEKHGTHPMWTIGLMFTQVRVTM